MNSMGELCTGCGKCCEKYGANLQADGEDIERWKAEASEVIDYVAIFFRNTGHECGDLWIDPNTGDEMTHCPWLVRDRRRKIPFRCAIHPMRPNVCRDYPISLEQAIQDGCEIANRMPTSAIC